MIEVAGIESPKWTTINVPSDPAHPCNGQMFLTIVATPLEDGRWWAFGPWKDGKSVITGHTPEGLVRSMVDIMTMWSNAGKLKLPNVLRMTFVDDRKLGRDRFLDDIIYTFSLNEPRDHEWNDAWGAFTRMGERPAYG